MKPERHGAPAPEVGLRLEPAEAYFRFPSASGN